MGDALIVRTEQGTREAERGVRPVRVRDGGQRVVGRGVLHGAVSREARLLFGPGPHPRPLAGGHGVLERQHESKPWMLFGVGPGGVHDVEVVRETPARFLDARPVVEVEHDAGDVGDVVAAPLVGSWAVEGGRPDAQILLRVLARLVLEHEPHLVDRRGRVALLRPRALDRALEARLVAPRRVQATLHAGGAPSDAPDLSLNTSQGLRPQLEATQRRDELREREDLLDRHGVEDAPESRHRQEELAHGVLRRSQQAVCRARRFTALQGTRPLEVVARMRWPYPLPR